jgi:hypothetical protein
VPLRVEGKVSTTLLERTRQRLTISPARLAPGIGSNMIMMNEISQ